jgi:hypothetical protein
MQRAQQEILHEVIELLVALIRRTIEQFFPNGEMEVRDGLELIYAVITLADRNIRGHETTQAELQRRTRIPDTTLAQMQRLGLIYTQGPQGRGTLYYVDLNFLDTPEHAAHLTDKVRDILRAANRITEIQNRRDDSEAAE